jgi:hypothetical protein
MAKVSFLFGSIGLAFIAVLGSACASSSENDGDSTAQDQTAATALLDGQNLTAAQLLTLAPIGDGTKAAAVLFPSSGDPEIRGNIVAGGKVTVVYALNRLSQCRATHDGFQIWDTRIGGEFSNGTKIGEERGIGNDGQPQGSVRGFDPSTFGAHLGAARVVPLTFDVPLGAERFFLYAHNTSPPGPSDACDTFDSKLSANLQFKVAANAANAPALDGDHATVDTLASLVDIGDGSDTAAILFGTSGDPVLRGKLVQGGRVIVAYALDRLPQCRATHDGFPFWVTQIGGEFSDGTKLGDETTAGQSFMDDASSEAGHVVRFIPKTVSDGADAAAIPTVFAVPKSATELQLYAHNWNPGGPVSPCSSFDSLGGRNYHFPVQTR